MASAHGQSATVVTAPVDNKGPHVLVYCIISLGGFKSHIGFVTVMQSVIQYVPQIYAVILAIVTLVAQPSLLQSINVCLYFVFTTV
jgi:hypothetical protein